MTETPHLDRIGLARYRLRHWPGMPSPNAHHIHVSGFPPAPRQAGPGHLAEIRKGGHAALRQHLHEHGVRHAAGTLDQLHMLHQREHGTLTARLTAGDEDLDEHSGPDLGDEDRSDWDESDWDDVRQHLEGQSPWFRRVMGGESPGDPDAEPAELGNISLTPRTAEASTVHEPTVWLIEAAGGLWYRDEGSEPGLVRWCNASDGVEASGEQAISLKLMWDHGLNVSQWQHLSGEDWVRL